MPEGAQDKIRQIKSRRKASRSKCENKCSKIADLLNSVQNVDLEDKDSEEIIATIKSVKEDVAMKE